MGSFIKNELEPFSYLIYLFAIFFEYKREKSVLKGVLLAFYFFSFLSLSYACKIALDENDNNNWIYNIHYIVSSIVFGYFFFRVLSDRNLRLLSMLLFGFTFLVLVITSYFIQKTVFNSYGSALLFIVIVLSCFLFLRQKFKSVNEEPLFLRFDMWLVSGYLLYFLGAFLVILMYRYYTNKLPPEKQYLLADIWAVQNVLLFVSSLLVLIGFLWGSFRKKQLL